MRRRAYTPVSLWTWGFESPARTLLTSAAALHLPVARGLAAGCQWLVNRTCRLVVVAEDQPGHGAGRELVQAGQDVAVGVHGDGDVRVPQPLADDLCGDAGGQRGGGVAVADVVQPDPRQPGRPGVLLEPLREPLRVDRPA